MNDKEFNKLKKKITRFVEKWRVPLGIKWWSVNFYYEREYAKDDDKHDSCHTGATCKVQWPYKTAQITFYLPALDTLDDEELERTVVHELIHILVNEMRDFDEGANHEERVVSDLTSAVFWIRDKCK